ncbi:MAG: aminotransferase class V-fold PLP-dependent enzyme [Mariniblastus sp.]
MDTLKTKFDPLTIRDDFPILNQTIHRNRPLVYLDNGASTQHPQAVIDAMSDCYEKTYANVHRGIHWLSEQASGQYEEARTLVQKFINAPHNNEVIFTSGTTESINLVAHAWGNQNVQAGDEILLTIFEHHSNIVPWQQLAARTGAVVRFVSIDENGGLDIDDFKSQLNVKTKIVAFAAVSNVLGTITPVAKIVSLARSVGAVSLVDAAQSVPHDNTDVQAWDADFVTFSAHKMLGPSGVGVLWGKQDLLESMPPFMGGGSMIDQVTIDGFTQGELPARFEAGTPPIVEAIGLGAAIKYLNGINLESINQHEKDLASAAHKSLSEFEGLTILGPAADQRAGLVSFVIEGISPQDISILLDQQGVAIRAGHHCAMPLHQHLKIRSSCRASFYLYNTHEEVNLFVEALKKVIGKLR